MDPIFQFEKRKDGLTINLLFVIEVAFIEVKMKIF